jgi:hypothetical protein
MASRAVRLTAVMTVDDSAVRSEMTQGFHWVEQPARPTDDRKAKSSVVPRVLPKAAVMVAPSVAYWAATKVVWSVVCLAD